MTATTATTSTTATRPSRPTHRSRAHRAPTTTWHVTSADPAARARARLLVAAVTAVLALFLVGCLVGSLQLILDATAS